MNWEAIGAIGELVGAVGVIFSLLYLATQVRASTRASAVESKIASTRFYTDFLSGIIQSPELQDLFLRGRKDLEALTPEERIRYSNLALQSFSFFSAAYFQYRNGTLQEDDWYENRSIIQFWLRGAGCRQWWNETGQYLFGEGFRALVESEMTGQLKSGQAD